jgi:hypothetical protein
MQFNVDATDDVVFALMPLFLRDALADDSAERLQVWYGSGSMGSRNWAEFAEERKVPA